MRGRGRSREREVQYIGRGGGWERKTRTVVDKGRKTKGEKIWRDVRGDRVQKEIRDVFRVREDARGRGENAWKGRGSARSG